MSIRSLLGKFGRNRHPDRTEEILLRHLDGEIKVFPMADSPVTEGQFDALEAKYGVRYPWEFRAHVLGRFPGVYIEVKEEFWARPKLLDVGPFWSFLYAVHTYTSAPESEPWMKLDDAAQTLREGQPDLTAAPILRIRGDADLYCTTAAGSIVRYRHETGALEPFDGDFWQLFEQEVRELIARKARKKQLAE